MIKSLINSKKIEVEIIENQDAIRQLQMDFRIETAEAQALWLSKKLGCLIAIDDGPAIRACKVLGLQFATADHFLLNLQAHKKLEIPVALAKLDSLSGYGRYNRKIIDDAARRLNGGN